MQGVLGGSGWGMGLVASGHGFSLHSLSPCLNPDLKTWSASNFPGGNVSDDVRKSWAEAFCQRHLLICWFLCLRVLPQSIIQVWFGHSLLTLHLAKAQRVYEYIHTYIIIISIVRKGQAVRKKAAGYSAGVRQTVHWNQRTKSEH